MTKQELTNRGTGVAKWSFPPVHPEGRKFGLIAAAITAVFAFMAWETLAWPMAGVTIWTLAFFRDPARATPVDDRFIVSPADGLVTLIERVPPPPELAGPAGLGDQPMTRVSIFMSVFDVHINRAPIRGTITRVAYIAGKFLNADLDKASEENERQHFLVERPDGVRIGFTQIAGLVARRCGCGAACWPDPFWQPGGCLSAAGHCAADHQGAALHCRRNHPCRDWRRSGFARNRPLTGTRAHPTP
jgi:phosphatidylserine decarboxylase